MRNKIVNTAIGNKHQLPETVNIAHSLLGFTLAFLNISRLPSLAY